MKKDYATTTCNLCGVTWDSSHPEWSCDCRQDVIQMRTDDKTHCVVTNVESEPEVPEATPPYKPYSLKMTFTQTADCNRGGYDDNELEVWSEDSGAGSYICFATKRWAIDDVDELVELLTEFKIRGGAIFEK
jgi:hypothetical protein